MAIGRQNQLENSMTWWIKNHDIPWRVPSRSLRSVKKLKHRRERQRVRLNVECFAEYNRYYGYEW